MRRRKGRKDNFKVKSEEIKEKIKSKLKNTVFALFMRLSINAYLQPIPLVWNNKFDKTVKKKN